MTKKFSFFNMMREWQSATRGTRLTEADPEDEDEDESMGDDSLEAGDIDEPGDEFSETEPTEPAEPVDEPDHDPSVDVEKDHSESPEDSLDNQIDALLIAIEKDAIEENIFSSKSLYSLYECFNLREASEDDEEDDDNDLTVDNSEPSDDVDFEEMNQPNLNIDEFTQRIARLVNNYTSLLDVPRAIRDRAVAFLIKNYDEATAEEFEEILHTQHGIKIEDDIDDDAPVLGPPAYGAGGEGGDLSGGGITGSGEGGI